MWCLNETISDHTTNTTDFDGVPSAIDLKAAIELYGTLTIASFTVYGIAWMHGRSLIAPRQVEHKSLLNDEHTQKKKRPILGWMLATLTSRHSQELIEQVGLDCYCSLRIIAFSFCTVLFFLTIGAVLSIVYHFTHSEHSENFVGSISMSGIEREYLWVPTIAIALVTLFVLMFLEREYIIQTDLRHNYFLKRPPQLYTVLWKHVPRHLRSKRNLFNYLDSLFPSKVAKIEMAGVDKHLNNVAEKRRKVISSLEKAIQRKQKTGKEPTSYVKNCTNVSNCFKNPLRKVESISFYSKLLYDLNQEFVELKHKHQMDTLIVNNDKHEVIGFDTGSTSIEEQRIGEEDSINGIRQTTNEHVEARINHDQNYSTNETQHLLDNSDQNQHDDLNTGSNPSNLSDSVDIEQHSNQQPEYLNQARSIIENTHRYSEDETIVPVGTSLNNGVDTSNVGSPLFHGDNIPTTSKEEDQNSTQNCAAFITFNSARAAAIASQMPIDSNYGYHTEPSPHPTDIAWDNIGIVPKWEVLQTIIVRLCFLGIVVLWGFISSVFAAGTQGIDCPEEKSMSASIKCFVSRFWYFVGCIFGATDFLKKLSPFLFTFSLSLTNPILGLLVPNSGNISWSTMDHQVTNWYFLFLVLQVFLVYGLGGSLLKILNDFSHTSNASFLRTLGESIPKYPEAYMQYILIMLFTSLSMNLLRVSNLVLGLLRRILFGRDKTEGDRFCKKWGMYNARHPAPQNLTSINATNMFVLFIACTFAVINPAVSLVALVYFAIALLVYTISFTSSSLQLYDSGGQYFPHAFRIVVAALSSGQITTAGVLMLQDENYFYALVVFSCFIGSLYKARMLESTYSIYFEQIPLALADELDKESQVNEYGHAKLIELSTPRIEQGYVVFESSEGTKQMFHLPHGDVKHDFPELVIGQTGNKRFDATCVYSYIQPVLNQKGRILVESETLERYSPPSIHV